jgi:hypothetical protein
MQLPGGGGVGWIDEIRQTGDETEYRMQFGTKWYSHTALADHKAKNEAAWKANVANSPLLVQPRRGRIVSAHRLGRSSWR